MKRLKTLLITVFFLIITVWILGKLNLVPDIGNLFSQKPVVIDETAILIKEIRSIGQVVTATLVDEVVVDSIGDAAGSGLIDKVNKRSPFPILPTPKKELVIIAKGKVLAGVDLQLLDDSSVKVLNDTVWLRLPPVKILDVIINPAGYETFQESGEWSHAEVTALKLSATDKIKTRAVQQNIIALADKKARSVLKNFLHAAGFATVYIL